MIITAQPADHSTLFYDHALGYPNIPIGTIEGAPVLASYTHDGEIYSADMTWHGMKISTDGKSYVNLSTGDDPGDTLGCVGDMHIHEWETIKALVQLGIVDQLIALARQYATIGH